METGPGKKLFRGSGIEWRERFPTLKRKHRPPISGPGPAFPHPLVTPVGSRQGCGETHYDANQWPAGDALHGRSAGWKEEAHGEGSAERCDEFTGEGFEGFEGLLPQRSAGRWLRIHTCAKRRADTVIRGGKIFW